MRSLWQCAIQGRVLSQTISSVFSRLSTPRSPTASGWGCRSAGPSSTPMGAGCGLKRIAPARRRIPVHLAERGREFMNSLRSAQLTREPREGTVSELLINWLAKVINDPIVQGAGPVDVIGVSSHENCRNRVPCIDEVSVEFDSGHRRHVYVGDQAGRFGETGDARKFGGRCRKPRRYSPMIS